MIDAEAINDLTDARPVVVSILAFVLYLRFGPGIGRDVLDHPYRLAEQFFDRLVKELRESQEKD